MAETRSLAAARRHLARAESELRSADGLLCLTEGLALLEEVALEGSRQERGIAANLLETYAEKICGAVRAQVAADPALPEPELEHSFKVLCAFDATEHALPDYARGLKIEIAKRLVDRYYEGYPENEKQKALEQLAGIADSS